MRAASSSGASQGLPTTPEGSSVVTPMTAIRHAGTMSQKGGVPMLTADQYREAEFGYTLEES
jgi:hypothetical protein